MKPTALFARHHHSITRLVRSIAGYKSLRVALLRDLAEITTAHLAVEEDLLDEIEQLVRIDVAPLRRTHPALLAELEALRSGPLDGPVFLDRVEAFEAAFRAHAELERPFLRALDALDDAAQARLVRIAEQHARGAESRPSLARTGSPEPATEAGGASG